MRRLILPLLILVVVMAVLFAALNPGVIDVDLGIFETRMQKSLALILAFAAGSVFGMLCLVAALVRKYFELQRLRKALRLAEAEVHTLRSMPPAHAD
jgi:uncharacterized membrane protein YciS (DUF1049 family)